ncbi:MAG: serine hydrolase [Chloroflexi bacterium]|nr:serine hydrolase [Chloroflexota bacterium]
MARFLIVLVVLALGCSPAYALQPSNPNPALALLWEQIHAQPDDFSAACMPLSNRAAMLLYNAYEPFPLASVSKLLIFIEYARQVDAGLIPIGETVEVATLNLYDLPRTNRGAHGQFMALYPPETQHISLWDVAAIGMIQYSSNAASDYLLDRLGPVVWYTLYRTLGVTGTGAPHSLSIIPLLMNNHETGEPGLDDIPLLSITQGEKLFERYVQDPAWRLEEIAYRADRRRSFPTWDVQAAILQQHTVTGTAYDFINIMDSIYGAGGPLPDTVKLMVRAALAWKDNEFINETYIEYGSKLGFYSGGVLALVAFGYPYEGQPVISAVFMRNIPRRVYNELLEQDSIGYLAHWMNRNACAGLLEAIYAGG